MYTVSVQCQQCQIITILHDLNSIFFQFLIAVFKTSLTIINYIFVTEYLNLKVNPN